MPPYPPPIKPSGNSQSDRPFLDPLDKNTVILSVDMQNGFIGRDPKTGLPVRAGAGVSADFIKENKAALRALLLAKQAAGTLPINIYLTMDWHPPIHANVYADNLMMRHCFEKELTETQKPETGKWARHCVQGSGDAQIHPDIIQMLHELQGEFPDALTIRHAVKGMGQNDEMYSAGSNEPDNPSTARLLPAGFLTDEGKIKDQGYQALVDAQNKAYEKILDVYGESKTPADSSFQTFKEVHEFLTHFSSPIAVPLEYQIIDDPTYLKGRFGTTDKALIEKKYHEAVELANQFQQDASYQAARKEVESAYQSYKKAQLETQSYVNDKNPVLAEHFKKENKNIIGQGTCLDICGGETIKDLVKAGFNVIDAEHLGLALNPAKVAPLREKIKAAAVPGQQVVVTQDVNDFLYEVFKVINEKIQTGKLNDPDAAYKFLETAITQKQKAPHPDEKVMIALKAAKAALHHQQVNRHRP